MMAKRTAYDTRHEGNARVTGLRNDQACRVDNHLIAGQIYDLSYQNNLDCRPRYEILHVTLTVLLNLKF